MHTQTLKPHMSNEYRRGDIGHCYADTKTDIQPIQQYLEKPLQSLTKPIVSFLQSKEQH